MGPCVLLFSAPRKHKCCIIIKIRCIYIKYNPELGSCYELLCAVTSEFVNPEEKGGEGLGGGGGSGAMKGFHGGRLG